MEQKNLMEDLDRLIYWLDAYATYGGYVTPPKGLEILGILECCRDRILDQQARIDILEAERRTRCGRQDRL